MSLKCPKCGSITPAGSLSLSCTCGYDFATQKALGWGLKRILCGLGFHRLPPWKDDYCEQSRTCERQQCVYTETRISHHLTEWKYVLDKPSSLQKERSCQQEARCQHCGQVLKTRILHGSTSSIWCPNNKNTCKKVSTCNRCGRQMSVSFEPHDWLPGCYIKDGSCKKIKKCSRCGDSVRYVEHELEEVGRDEYGDSPPHYACKRCPFYL